MGTASQPEQSNAHSGLKNCQPVIMVSRVTLIVPEVLVTRANTGTNTGFQKLGGLGYKVLPRADKMQRYEEKAHHNVVNDQILIFIIISLSPTNYIFNEFLFAFPLYYAWRHIDGR